MMKKMLFTILSLCVFFFGVNVVDAKEYALLEEYATGDMEVVPDGAYVFGSYLFTTPTSMSDFNLVMASKTGYADEMYNRFFDDYYATYNQRSTNDIFERGNTICIDHVDGDRVDEDCPNPGGGSGSTNTATAFFHSERTLYQVFFEPGTAVSQAKPKDKEGYEFRCWVNFEGDGAPENRDCIDFEAPGYTTPDGFHFESSYNHIEYTIKYNINGGTGRAPADTTCDYDFMNIAEGLENNPCAFASGEGLTKTGYYFVGWSLNKDFNSTSEQYFQAGTNLKPVLKDKPEITLYAVWQPKTYNLVVNKNNGEEVLRIPYTYNSQGAKVNLILPSKPKIRSKDYYLPILEEAH